MDQSLIERNPAMARLELSRRTKTIAARLQAFLDLLGFIDQRGLAEGAYQLGRLETHSGLLHAAAMRSARQHAPPSPARTTAMAKLDGASSRDGGIGRDVAAKRVCGADDVECERAEP